jgi:hypothetical protein
MAAIVRFDIALKVVRFKNGQYGIRRFSIILGQYQFLGMATDQDFWWHALADYVATYASGSKEDVQERLNLYLKKKAKKKDRSDEPGYDKGVKA